MHRVNPGWVKKADQSAGNGPQHLRLLVPARTRLFFAVREVFWSGIALQQVTETIEEFLVFQDVERPPSTILAAGHGLAGMCITCPERPLLIQITEDAQRLGLVGADADFGVIVIRPFSACQADG